MERLERNGSGFCLFWKISKLQYGWRGPKHPRKTLQYIRYYTLKLLELCVQEPSFYTQKDTSATAKKFVKDRTNQPPKNAFPLRGVLGTVLADKRLGAVQKSCFWIYSYYTEGKKTSCLKDLLDYISIS